MLLACCGACAAYVQPVDIEDDSEAGDASMAWFVHLERRLQLMEMAAGLRPPIMPLMQGQSI